MRRSSKRRNRSKGKLRNFIIFIIILPLISILIGVGIVKFIILPRTSINKDTKSENEEVIDDVNKDDVQSEKKEQDSKTEETDKEDNNREQEKITKVQAEGFDLYNIQIGSFNSKENAQVLLNQLNDKGLYGYLIKDKAYKVYVATFFNEEEAEEYKKEVKKTYKDSFTDRITVEDLILEYNKENEVVIKDFINLITIINNSYGEETSLWNSVIRGGDVSIVKEFMTNNTNNIRQELTGISDKVANKNFGEKINYIKENIKIREEIISGLNKNESVGQLYIKFNEGLFQYVNIFSK
ncbi:SPOR domain-containing protein [Dethiothermospora halolimnae]|uniref:SPOR domain-containing protein n=1 Tax=Dethiothermospora halolimnae TaxID=3114390 RepID=UPI003CCBF7B1